MIFRFLKVLCHALLIVSQRSRQQALIVARRELRGASMCRVRAV